MKRLLGFLAMAGLMLLAVPVERAQAVSLINPADRGADKNLVRRIWPLGSPWRWRLPLASMAAVIDISVARTLGTGIFRHRHLTSTAHTSTGRTPPACLASVSVLRRAAVVLPLGLHRHRPAPHLPPSAPVGLTPATSGGAAQEPRRNAMGPGAAQADFGLVLPVPRLRLISLNGPVARSVAFDDRRRGLAG